MKRLHLSGALLGLTALLSACGGGDTPAVTHSLTIKLEGVPRAPVTVTDVTTDKQVFKGTLEGSKTFGDLKAGDLFKVEGGAVSGFTAPAAQSVTLDGDKSVTLTYKPTTQPSPPTVTRSLTVKVEEVKGAPVTVTNTTTSAQVFSGTIEGSKTFGGLKAGDVFRVEGGAVNGFTAPAAQTVTLDGDKTVTLSYKAASQSTLLDPARLDGKIGGWTYGALTPVLYSLGSEDVQPLTGSSVAADGTVSVTLPRPSHPFSLLGGCSFSGTRSTEDVQVELADVVLMSAQGDILGELTQAQADGQLLTRLYSSADGRFNGTADCTYFTLKLELDLKAGWNAVVLGGSGSQTTLTSVAPGTPVSLKFIQAEQRADFQFADTSTLTLRAGQPVTREVKVYQDGGLSGQLSLSTDVPGVVVTPGTLTLPSLSAQSLGSAPLLRALGRIAPQAVTTTLTFSLNDSAATYSGPLNLLARQGDRTVGSANLYAEIRVPSVAVTVNVPSGTTLSGYQGETLRVPLSLTPQDGFSGSVTITLDGLPAGLSVSPTTVNLTPGATTNIELPVQVGADAVLGEVSARVSGGKVTPTDLTLQLKPARTLLDVQGTPSSLTAAAQGVWVMAAFQTGTTGSYVPQPTFRRYQGGQAAAEVTLSDVYGELLRVPGGDAYAISAYYSSATPAIYRLKDDGSVTKFTINGFSSGPNKWYGKVDGQGRLWYIGSSIVGTSTYGLYRLDPATGESTLIDAQNIYTGGLSNKDFASSNNGRYLVYTGSYNSRPLLIDTETSSITPVTVVGGGSVGSAAVSDSGQVWYEINGRLTRVNSDGTSTTFTPAGGSVYGIIGLDQQQAGVLWLRGSQGIVRFDSADASSRIILTDSVQASALNSDGGLTILIQAPADGKTRSYLSTLR